MNLKEWKPVSVFHFDKHGIKGKAEVYNTDNMTVIRYDQNGFLPTCTEVLEWHLEIQRAISEDKPILVSFADGTLQLWPAIDP